MEPLIDGVSEHYGTPKYAGQIMTKSDFLKWEADDAFVYEYNNGRLEPSLSMKQEEVQLLQRLTRRFQQTDAYRQEGELVAEVDVWLTDKQMRRPDVAYYNPYQLRQMADGNQVVPGFAVEFISDNDDIRKYIKKLNEYFQAGVQVVWLVFSNDQTVYVYTSPKTVTIATDTDVVSAAPVLPELQITVDELFRR